MKRTKRKILSVLLIAAMVLSIIPLTGFTDAHAQNALCAHTHGAECYAVLEGHVCAEETGCIPCYPLITAETDSGHTHSEACYEDETLICGEEERAAVTEQIPDTAAEPTAWKCAALTLVCEHKECTEGEPCKVKPTLGRSTRGTGADTIDGGSTVKEVIADGDDIIITTQGSENKVINVETWNVDVTGYGSTDYHLKYTYQPALNGEFAAFFQLIAAEGISGSGNFNANTRDWSDVWSILHNEQICPGRTAAIYGGATGQENINSYAAFMDYVDAQATTSVTYSSETYYEYIDGKLTPITVNTTTNWTVYDLILRKYTMTTLTDNGVAVSGAFEQDAVLTAQTAAAASTACEDIIAADSAGKLIALYDLSVTGSYTGDVIVTIPVDAAYNGRQAEIIHHKAGGDEKVTATVADGKVTGTFSSLSPFGVALLGGAGPQDGLYVNGTKLDLEQNSSGAGWSYTALTRILTVTQDITVTGAADNQTEELKISIADGKTVNWQADYSADSIEGEGCGLFFQGGNGKVSFSGCSIQSSSPATSLVYSRGDIHIGAGANIVYMGENGHAVKTEGGLVTSGGYVSATSNSSNALASEGDMAIHGGFVEAGWLALSVYSGDLIIDGGFVYGGSIAVLADYSDNITIAGGVLQSGEETAIKTQNIADVSVSVSGGLLLVAGEDVASAYLDYSFEPPHAGLISRTSSGIIAAFDKTQTGPFTEGTHTALVSSPANALTWAIQDGHGGVAYGSGKFLDMGVSVLPAQGTFVPVTGITGVPTTATAGTELVLRDTTSVLGTVVPANATNNFIDWGVKSADMGIEYSTSYGYVDGHLVHYLTVTPNSAGTIVLTATVANGATATTPYTQDFTITVTAPGSGGDPQPTTYSFTRSAGTGGSVSGTASGSYEAGAAISVTATVNSGYHFTGWTVSGTTITGGNTANPATFTMPANAVTIAANFAQDDNGGGGSDTDPQPVNAILNVTAAAFDKNAASADYRDIAVTLNPGSYTLAAIKNGSYTLVSGTDYTVSGSAYTIKAAYLATLALGTQNLTFDMNGGADPVLTISIGNTTPYTPDPGAGGDSVNGGDNGNAAQPPVQNPSIPAVNGAVRVEYSQTGSDATLDLPQSKIEEIIQKANGTADFDLTGITDATSAALSKAAMTAFADAGLTLTVKLPQGTIKLDPAATRSLVASAQGAVSNLAFTLRKIRPDELNAAQGAAVKASDTVYEICVLSGTQQIHSFTGAVSLTVPYTGKAPAAAWHLDGEGKKETVSATLDGTAKTVTLTLPHLSYYGFGEEETAVEDNDTPLAGLPIEEETTVEDNDTPLVGLPNTGKDIPQTGDTSNTTLWLILLGAALAGLGGVWFISRKKREEAN